MPDKKISELDAITTLDGTEEFVVAKSSTTKKITAANLATDLLVAADIPITDAGAFYTTDNVEAALQQIAGGGGGGGGGVGWEESFFESGASLANWTADSGSWSVVSGAFHVDTTGGTIARLKYNTAQSSKQLGLWVFQADIKMTSAGIGSNAPAGLLFYWDGAGSGDPAVELFKAGAGAGTKQVRTEQDQTVNRVTEFTPSPTWALDAFHTLKIVVLGTAVSVLLDDVQVATSTGFGAGPGQDAVGDYGHTADRFVGLVANNAVVDFKNIGLKFLPLPDSGGGVQPTEIDPVQILFGAPNTAFEFASSSLAGLTALGTPDEEAAHTTVPDHYYIRDNASGIAWCGRYLAPPATPYTVIAKLRDATVAEDFNAAGLFLAVSPPGAMDVIAWRAGSRDVNCENFTNPTTFNTGFGDNLGDDSQCPYWFAIRVNSSSSVDYLFSYTGFLWRKLQLGRNPGFSLGAVGIGIKSQNANGLAAAFDFLRIFNSALTMPGG